MLEAQQQRIEGDFRDWPDLAAYRKEALEAQRNLSLVRRPGHRAAGIWLFSTIRNERGQLPLFLDHYRGLGVVRFVIVDNDSSDGSVEWLRDQPDVELYHTAASFAGANGGILWIEGLMYEQSRGAWVVYADADELLVYDRCDQYKLPALVAHLEALGERKLLAPLVDLYSHPTDIDTLLFDAAPEYRRRGRHGLYIHGGPRYRMAKATGRSAFPCLTKYPLAYYDEHTAFANIHFPRPQGANAWRIRGRLLHLKLGAGFSAKVDAALREGQHWHGGIEYEGYAQWLAEHDPADLATDVSRRYGGPGDLIDAGLLEPLDWRASKARLRMRGMLDRLWHRH